MQEAIITIRKQLKKQLSSSRYEHTLGVSYTAAALAMKYGGDLKKAALAGMLHDCAKCYDDVTIVEMCRTHGIALTESELRAPAVIHAKLGAYLAEQTYEIQDPEILSAIAYHTTGKPDMTRLEKIIYIADYIEPGRDKAPNLTALRKLAFEDLDEALYQILSATLSYLVQSGSEADEMTQRAYDYYEELRKRS